MTRCSVFTAASVGLVFLVIFGFSSTVFALEGTLEPFDPVIVVGSNLTLNCTPNSISMGNRTARDIVWYHQTSQMSQDSYVTISERTSLLSLTNVTLDDSGKYWCAFPEDSFYEGNGSTVYVGIKPRPALLECFVRNPDEYWCRWTEEVDTNLRTEHKFTYGHQSGGEGHDCPDLASKGQNTCFVSIDYNTGTRQYVRVTSTNDLGTAYVEKNFHPYEDVVVNPPGNVRLVRMDSETSLRILWSIPSEWNRYGTLDYKLRYMRDDCKPINNTCCCWKNIPSIGTAEPLFSYILKDLDPYTLYSVQLAARYGIEDDNWSEWSEAETERTRETAITAAVQDLKVGDEEDNPDDPIWKRDVSVFWTGLPKEQQHGELLGYKIIVEEDNSRQLVQENTTEPHQHRFTLTGLEKFHRYQVKVAAENSVGLGPWSQVLGIPNHGTAPNPPDEVTAVAISTTSIRVNWTQPSQPNGFILYYTVQWGKSNGHKMSYTTPNADQLSHVLEDLDTFALYEISVKATNSRGDSGFQSVRGGVRTLEGVPDAAPANLKVDPVENQPNKLTLMWERLPPANTNGNLTGYLISFCMSGSYYDATTKRKCTGAVQQQNVTRPEAVTETLTGLEPSTNYSVWLEAYTAIGKGPESKPVQARTGRKTEGILLQVIFIPLAVLVGVILIACCAWKKCQRTCRDIPGPKFNKNVNQLKNGSCGISRSNSKLEKEYFDEIIELPQTAIITGLSDHNVEEAKVTLQKSSLGVFSNSVQLISKTSAMFTRSESRDSGVPPSPVSESPDFSSIRDKPSITEDGDDSVFLDEDDGGLPTARPEKLTVQMNLVSKDKAVVSGHYLPNNDQASPSSPTETVGPYTLVGQLTTSKCAPRASVSSPGKSPKKVSFELASKDGSVPLFGSENKECFKPSTHGDNQTRDQQKPSGSSNRSSFSSSVAVSPYTQMSAMESLHQCQRQQNHQATRLPSVSDTKGPGEASVSLPSSSAAVVSPYTQMPALEQLKPKQQKVLQLKQQGGDSRSREEGKPTIGMPSVSPYTQMSEIEAMQPPQNKTIQSQHLPSVTAPRHSPQPLPSPAISPYTQMSDLLAMQQKQNTTSSSKTNQSLQLSLVSPGKQSNPATQSVLPPPMSPYTSVPEMGALQPRQVSTSQSTRLPSVSTTENLNCSPPPVVPTTVVSPYTQLSEMESVKLMQNKTSHSKQPPSVSTERSPSVSHNPTPSPAVLPYAQMSEINAMQSKKVKNSLPEQLSSVSTKENRNPPPLNIPPPCGSPYSQMPAMPIKQPVQLMTRQPTFVSPSVNLPEIQDTHPSSQSSPSQLITNKVNQLSHVCAQNPIETCHAPASVSPYTQMSEVRASSQNQNNIQTRRRGSVNDAESHSMVTCMSSSAVPPKGISPYVADLSNAPKLSEGQSSPSKSYLERTSLVTPTQQTSQNVLPQDGGMCPPHQQCEVPHLPNPTKAPQMAKTPSVTFPIQNAPSHTQDYVVSSTSSASETSKTHDASLEDPMKVASGYVHAPVSRAGVSDRSHLQAASSDEDYHGMKEPALSRSLPADHSSDPGSDPYPKGEVEECPQTSQQTASQNPQPVFGVESATAVSSASNPEVTDYTQAGRSADHLSSARSPQENLSTTRPAADTAPCVSGYSQVAGSHNDSQDSLQMHSGQLQHGPSSDSDFEDVEDYTQVPTQNFKSAFQSKPRPALAANDSSGSASNPAITNYTQIGRNGNLLPPTHSSQENVAADTSQGVPRQSQMAVRGNVAQEALQTRLSNIQPNSQGNASETSTSVADYSSVAAVGSSASLRGAGLVESSSRARNHSETRSTDDGFSSNDGNDDDSASLRQPLSDYVQAGTLPSDVNSHSRQAPIATPSTDNTASLAASTAQPVSDYVLTGTGTNQGTVNR